MTLQTSGLGKKQSWPKPSTVHQICVIRGRETPIPLLKTETISKRPGIVIAKIKAVNEPEASSLEKDSGELHTALLYRLVLPEALTAQICIASPHARPSLQSMATVYIRAQWRFFRGQEKSQKYR